MDCEDTIRLAKMNIPKTTPFGIPLYPQWLHGSKEISGIATCWVKIDGMSGVWKYNSIDQ